MKRFQVSVFGKEGCDKCKVLKARLEKILQEEAYLDFEMRYYDLGTVDGLVHFSQSEVLNPQRIPGFIVYRQSEDSGKTVLQPVLDRIESYGVDGETLETFLGIQTDYRTTGAITPQMIKDVLNKTLELSRAGV